MLRAAALTGTVAYIRPRRVQQKKLFDLYRGGETMFFAARLPLGTNVERCEIKSSDCYTRDGARGGIKLSPYLLAKCETTRASSSSVD